MPVVAGLEKFKEEYATASSITCENADGYPRNLRGQKPSPLEVVNGGHEAGKARPHKGP